MSSSTLCSLLHLARADAQPQDMSPLADLLRSPRRSIVHALQYPRQRYGAGLSWSRHPLASTVDFGMVHRCSSDLCRLRFASELRSKRGMCVASGIENGLGRFSGTKEGLAMLDQREKLEISLVYFTRYTLHHPPPLSAAAVRTNYTTPLLPSADEYACTTAILNLALTTNDRAGTRGRRGCPVALSEHPPAPSVDLGA
eukprot:462414-Rhodomonas_salina.1